MFFWTFSFIYILNQFTRKLDIDYIYIYASDIFYLYIKQTKELPEGN